MNERDFVYWLQGYLEVSGAKELDEAALQIVKDHLALVLTKRTSKRVLSEQQELPLYCSKTDLEKAANDLKNHLTC